MRLKSFFFHWVLKVCEEKNGWFFRLILCVVDFSGKFAPIPPLKVFFFHRVFFHLIHIIIMLKIGQFCCIIFIICCTQNCRDQKQDRKIINKSNKFFLLFSSHNRVILLIQMLSSFLACFIKISNQYELKSYICVRFLNFCSLFVKNLSF